MFSICVYERVCSTYAEHLRAIFSIRRQTPCRFVAIYIDTSIYRFILVYFLDFGTDDDDEEEMREEKVVCVCLEQKRDFHWHTAISDWHK